MRSIRDIVITHASSKNVKKKLETRREEDWMYIYAYPRGSFP
jgi:hypothetical protein